MEDLFTEEADVPGAESKGLESLGRELDLGLSLLSLQSHFFLSPFLCHLFLSVCLSSPSKRKGTGNT